MTYDIAYFKARYDASRAAGICAQTTCKLPALPGKSRCERHMRYIVEKLKARMDGWREAGLCTGCGEPRDVPGLVRCSGCRAYVKAQYEKRRDASG